jgi:hypothetical protein
MNLEEFDNDYNVMVVHPSFYRYFFPTKWSRFLDGFYAIQDAIYFRFDYNDPIDYCAFWEVINAGYYQMQDEYSMSQPGFDPYNLSGRDPYYSYVMSKK